MTLGRRRCARRWARWRRGCRRGARRSLLLVLMAIEAVEAIGVVEAQANKAFRLLPRSIVSLLRQSVA